MNYNYDTMGTITRTFEALRSVPRAVKLGDEYGISVKHNGHHVGQFVYAKDGTITFQPEEPDHELRAVLAGLVAEHLNRLDPPQPQADDDVDPWALLERLVVPTLMATDLVELRDAARAALDARGQA